MHYIGYQNYSHFAQKEMIENVSGFDVRFIHTIGNFIDISYRQDSLIVFFELYGSTNLLPEKD